MRKPTTASVASGVLIVGAFIAVAISGPGVAVAYENAEVETATDVKHRPHRLSGGRAMDDVLVELTRDGVISQEQADQIKDAFEEEIAKRHEEFLNRRRSFNFRALLADGVIDADELSELGADHPFNKSDGPAAQYLDDGQLTAEELHGLRKQLHEQGGPDNDRGAARLPVAANQPDVFS